MNAIKQIASVPVLGWLFGALVVSLLFAWTMFQRARIYRQRLAISIELRAKERQHQKRIQKILETKSKQNTEAIKRAKVRAKVLELRKIALERDAQNLPALADHMNRVFK